MLFSLAVAGVFSIIISITIARYLTVFEFGVYSIIISIQTVVTLVAGFNIGTAVTKYIAEYFLTDREIAKRFAKIGIVLVILLSIISVTFYLGLSGPIGYGLYGESLIVMLIPYSALVVLSSAIFFVVFGIAQGCQKVRILAFMQIANPAICLSLIILLLPVVGIRGAFLGFFFAQAIVIILTLLWLNIKIFPFLSISIGEKRKKIVKRIFSFAFPAVLSSSMVGPIYWLANTELSLIFGFEAMAHFAVAMVFYQALAIFPNSIVIPLIPKISELNTNSKASVERIVIGSIKVASILFFPILFGVAIFSKEIVQLFYGSAYSLSAEIMYIMIFASYFYTLSAVIGALIAGLGRMWVGLGCNLIWAVIFLIIATIAIPIMGAKGLGIAFASSYCVHLAISTVISNRKLRVNIRGIFLIPIYASIFFIAGYITLFELTTQHLLIKIILLTTGIGILGIFEKDIFKSVFEIIQKR